MQTKYFLLSAFLLSSLLVYLQKINGLSFVGTRNDVQLNQVKIVHTFNEN